MNNKPQVKFLTHEEVRQIIDAIPDDSRGRRDRAIMETLYCTGLRVSELLSLKKDVLFKGDTDKTLEVVVIGKGGRQGLVFVSPQALQAVFRYFAGRIDEDERAFPIGVRMVQLMVKRRAAEAGIDKPLTVHTFRHSFATQILRKTGNIRLCQELCRHKSITSTQIYAGVTGKEMFETHKKIF